MLQWVPMQCRRKSLQRCVFVLAVLQLLAFGLPGLFRENEPLRASIFYGGRRGHLQLIVQSRPEVF